MGQTEADGSRTRVQRGGVVTIECADGARVVLSAAEIDATFFDGVGLTSITVRGAHVVESSGPTGWPQ